MKKIIIFFALVLIIITSSLGICANSDNIYEVELLEELGIVAPNFKNVYLPESKITIGEMLAVMQNIMYSNKYGSYDDEKAYSDSIKSGIFGMDKNTRHYDNAKYEHVLEAAFNILGYGPVARQKGNYPYNYISMPQISTISDGVKINLGGYISKKDFIKIIYNLFEAKTLQIDKITSDSLGFSYQEGKGILEVYQNVSIIEGIVEGTCYTKIYTNASNIPENKVLIDGVLYDNNKKDYSDVIGLKIKAFVKNDKNGVKTVKHFIKDENISQAMVTDNEILRYSPLERKLYYYNQKNKEAYFKISPDAAIMLNGCAKEDYNENTFLVKNGNITLYDNDSDKIYDVVHIVDYKTVYADYVSKNAEKIYNIYSNDADSKVFDLSNKKWVKCVVYKNGKECDKSVIKSGDVLAVLKGGTNDNGIIKIYVSDKTDDGVISEYNSVDNEISINSRVYKMSAGYVSAIKDNDVKAWQIKLGTPVKIHIDYFGKVSYIEPLKNEYVYGYALYTHREKDSEIRLLDEFSTWQSYVFADKVNFNNLSTKNGKEMYDELGGEDFIPQLVKYKLDKDNKIKEIYLASEVSTGAYDEFIVSGVEEKVFQYANMAFGSEAYLEDGAVIWNLAKETPTDEDDITISGTSELYSDRSYKYIQYNKDEYGFSKYFVIYDTDSNIEFKAKRSGVFVVDKVLRVVDGNGENKNAIRGMMFDYNNITVNFSDDTDLDGIKEGDTVSFLTNSYGEISKFNVIHRIKDVNVSLLPATIHTSVTYVGGILEKCDIANGKYKINCGGKMQVLKIDASTPSIVCEKFKNDVKLSKELITSADIGNYVLVRVQNSRVTNVVIYK